MPSRNRLSEPDAEPQEEEGALPAAAESWQDSALNAAFLYRDHWPEILRAMTGFLPKRVVDDDYRWRQIRLARDEAWQSNRWKADFRGACITCGFSRELFPAKRTFSCIDASRPARVAMAAMGVGMLLVLAWNFWWWLAYFLVVPLLMWWSVRGMKPEKAVVSFDRCDRHTDDEEWPKLYREKHQLVVVAGHPKMRKLWIQSQQGEAVPLLNSVLSEAKARAWQDHKARHARGPVLARIAGWIWLATGYLQWISASLEFLAILAASLTLGPGNVGGPIIFLMIYASIRFKAAEAFRTAGREMIHQEASDVLSNAIGSLGIGLLFLLPGLLIVSDVNLLTIEAKLVRESPLGVALLLSLAFWGLLLSTAGILALAGRSAYLGQTRRKESYCEVPCPMCRNPYRVYRMEDFDNMVQCTDCGEAFRLDETVATREVDQSK